MSNIATVGPITTGPRQVVLKDVQQVVLTVQDPGTLRTHHIILNCGCCQLRRPSLFDHLISRGRPLPKKHDP
jgi:hypothetical protein